MLVVHLDRCVSRRRPCFEQCKSDNPKHATFSRSSTFSHTRQSIRNIARCSLRDHRARWRSRCRRADIEREIAAHIKADLKPHFDADAGDVSGFFPTTTRRAIGLLGKSDACVDLALHPLFNDVASRFLTSTYSYWLGTERHTSVSKPQISSTVGFQVNTGGRQQALHRDEIDYHVHTTGSNPMMMGCVTAIMKTTAANGATVIIPGSHKWDADRCPYVCELTGAHLEQ